MSIQGILLQDLIGHRVRCDEMYAWIDSLDVEDKSAKALAGVCGTVTSIDSIGQIHVKWDNGSTLALNALTDKFTILD